MIVTPPSFNALSILCILCAVERKRTFTNEIEIQAYKEKNSNVLVQGVKIYLQECYNWSL